MKSTYKFLIGGIIILIVLAVFSIQGIQDMTVYFYTPTEVLAAPNKFVDKTIRIGALVEEGSVAWDEKKLALAFRVTENAQDYIPVVYQGIKPDMFREGRGVVIEGKMENNVFHASRLLVKHNEEYEIDSEEQANKKDYYKTLKLE